MITTVKVRNVYQALPEGCHQLREKAVERDSRNGRVKVVPGPFITEYTNPTERVEFHPERDSNPFFHLMESLWMLAGRNDVAWLERYNSKIGQFSDDGKTFNGAYGYRWTKQDFNQLCVVIGRLKVNPEDRRQVVTMYGKTDLAHQNSKDIPCNLQVLFTINHEGRLDMTVTNRSNDIIWGAYGANAVHFSVLQEYMAAQIGVPVGSYYQVSNNTHAYERHWDLVDKLAEKAAQPGGTSRERTCPYSCYHLKTVPLVEDLGEWGTDLHIFMSGGAALSNLFFQQIALPMREAWDAFKTDSPNRFDEALGILEQRMADSDWRLACRQWLLRRKVKHDAS